VTTPLLVLASSSPRRQELMQIGGWNFSVRPIDVDESRLLEESPETHVVRLAQEKARACSTRVGEDVVIIGADTVVVDSGDILGKPGSSEKAKAMLTRLRGHTHHVCTGIAILNPVTGALITDLCVTEVPMRSYSDADMDTYIRSGDPLDKAGAYAIQHSGFHPVERLAGCFASVMGLPLCHLARNLMTLGIDTTRDIAAECKTEFAYNCPISTAVLAGENVG
jgi:septum formation protein